MSRHTRLIEHILPNTRSILLDGKTRETIRGILKDYTRIMEIHIVQGEDIKVKCWESVWTSGL